MELCVLFDTGCKLFYNVPGCANTLSLSLVGTTLNCVHCLIQRVSHSIMSFPLTLSLLLVCTTWNCVHCLIQEVSHFIMSLDVLKYMKLCALFNNRKQAKLNREVRKRSINNIYLKCRHGIFLGFNSGSLIFDALKYHKITGQSLFSALVWPVV